MSARDSLVEASFATSQSQILDACCGGRHWWWDKDHPLAVYMDERQVPLGNEWRATWECSPDVVGDFRAMPFADESFQLVLFDPPHVVRKNLETKWSTRFYGALNPDTWQDDLRCGFAECWRVVAAGGTLVFKWSGDPARCSPYFPAEPLVGTRWKKDEDEAASWFIFYKPLGERMPDPWPIIEWLRENYPQALELCPYKIGGESVSREARAVEQREPDGGAASGSCSPPRHHFGSGNRCACGEFPTAFALTTAQYVDTRKTS